MFCTQCGKQLKDGVQFCTNCGKSLAVPSPKNAPPRKKEYHVTRIIMASLGSILGIIIIAVWLASSSETPVPQTNPTNNLNSTANNTNLTDSINRSNYNPTNNTGLNKLESQANALEKNKPSKLNYENGLPKLDYNAVVLIICEDDNGDYQQGSGTIVSSDGVVLTNKHVVTDDGGRILNCGMLMQDDDSVIYGLAVDNETISDNFDAALLKVSSAYNFVNDTDALIPSQFPFFELNYTKPEIGINIYILGYPSVADYVFNVSKGVVSSFSSDGVYINTDAKIDHGNSGGAVITTDGRFIGIPTQRYSQEGDYLGQILRLDALENDY